MTVPTDKCVAADCWRRQEPGSAYCYQHKEHPPGAGGVMDSTSRTDVAGDYYGYRHDGPPGAVGEDEDKRQSTVRGESESSRSAIKTPLGHAFANFAASFAAFCVAAGLDKAGLLSESGWYVLLFLGAALYGALFAVFACGYLVKHLVGARIADKLWSWTCGAIGIAILLAMLLAFFHSGPGCRWYDEVCFDYRLGE